MFGCIGISPFEPFTLLVKIIFLFCRNRGIVHIFFSLNPLRESSEQTLFAYLHGHHISTSRFTMQNKIYFSLWQVRSVFVSRPYFQSIFLYIYFVCHYCFRSTKMLSYAPLRKYVFCIKLKIINVKRTKCFDLVNSTIAQLEFVAHVHLCGIQHNHDGQYVSASKEHFSSRLLLYNKNHLRNHDIINCYLNHSKLKIEMLHFEIITSLKRRRKTKLQTFLVQNRFHRQWKWPRFGFCHFDVRISALIQTFLKWKYKKLISFLILQTKTINVRREKLIKVSVSILMKIVIEQQMHRTGDSTTIHSMN